MKKLGGYFMKFKPSDVTNVRSFSLAQKVNQIWKDVVHDNKYGHTEENILLVDFGDWLHQGSWTDETGFYIMFRLSPLFAKRESTKERALGVLRSFQALFPNPREVIIDGMNEIEEGGTEVITILVKTDLHSIGD